MKSADRNATRKLNTPFIVDGRSAYRLSAFLVVVIGIIFLAAGLTMIEEGRKSLDFAEKQKRLIDRTASVTLDMEIGDTWVFTQTKQDHDSQKWIINPPLGGQRNTHIIQHKLNDLYLDAWERRNDNRLVTREKQDETEEERDSQRWDISPVEGQKDTYTIQQKSNGRYIDAYGGKKSRAEMWAVTREKQDKTEKERDSQRWIIKSVKGQENTYTIVHKYNGRYLDAYDISGFWGARRLLRKTKSDIDERAIGPLNDLISLGRILRNLSLVIVPLGLLFLIQPVFLFKIMKFMRIDKEKMI